MTERVEDGGEPTLVPSTGPDPRELAARDGVRFRAKVHQADTTTFESVRRRVEDGLEWAVGAIVTSEEAVLLVRQDGQWMLPGGAVEAGETHATALVRELDEEAGLVVTPGPLRAVLENRYVHAGETTGFHFAMYEAGTDSRRLTDDPGLDGEGIVRVEWFASLPADTLDRDLLVELRRG